MTITNPACPCWSGLHFLHRPTCGCTLCEPAPVEKWFLRLTRMGSDVEVGPFDTPAAANEYLAEHRLQGSWMICPMQSPAGPPDWDWKGPQ